MKPGTAGDALEGTEPYVSGCIGSCMEPGTVGKVVDNSEPRVSGCIGRNK